MNKMGCKYCDDNFEFWQAKISGELPNVRFCPMCGRKLEREIKFRAWFEGHMYEIKNLDFWGDPNQAICDMVGMTLTEDGYEVEIFDVYLHEVKLMQYTGLKDQYGKEIYEGDVVDCFAGEHHHGVWEHHKRYVVEFGWTECMWEMLNCDLIEIIGNIYENQETRGKGAKCKIL